jgi:hypothetical protein
MKQQTVTIACPFCKHEQEDTLYPVIDLVAKPTLKLGILTGSLFSVTCKSCQRQFEVMHEVLTIDADARYAVFLVPECTLQEIDSSEATLSDFSLYQLRLVSSSNELKEKVLLFDGGLDDRTIELCKLYLLMQMQDKEVTLLFSEHQVSEGKLAFSIFDSQGVIKESIECEDALYSQLYKKGQAFALKETVFSKVDVNWAYSKIANA